MENSTRQTHGITIILKVIGLLLVLSGLWYINRNLIPKYDLLESSSSIPSYLQDTLLPYLSIPVFVVFSIFFARKNRILCYIPLAVYLVCKISSVGYLIPTITSGYNDIIYALQNNYLDYFFWCIAKLIPLIASLIVALLCYLDKIPSFFGGITLSVVAVVFMIEDLVYGIANASGLVFFSVEKVWPYFYNWPEIAVHLGFALCLFAYRRGETSGKHFSLKNFHPRNFKPTETVSYGFEPAESETSGEG